ncbi:hypothetical protein PC116_g18968 [Phytophthora cactorum]|nr:hypothetical protein PC116_g18968 [Phytophthora cactorum]
MWPTRIPSLLGSKLRLTKNGCDPHVEIAPVADPLNGSAGRDRDVPLYYALTAGLSKKSVYLTPSAACGSFVTAPACGPLSRAATLSLRDNRPSIAANKPQATKARCNRKIHKGALLVHDEKICKRLIASLPPPALPEDVKQCVKHTHVPAAKSSKLLFKLVEKKAREHERQYLRLQKQKREVADRPDKDKSMEKLHQAAQKRPWGKKKAPASADGKATAKVDQKLKPKPTTSARPPPGPCPTCQAIYWLRECMLTFHRWKCLYGTGLVQRNDWFTRTLKVVGRAPFSQ